MSRDAALGMRLCRCGARACADRRGARERARAFWARKDCHARAIRSRQRASYPTMKRALGHAHTCARLERRRRDRRCRACGRQKRDERLDDFEAHRSRLIGSLSHARYGRRSRRSGSGDLPALASRGARRNPRTRRVAQHHDGAPVHRRAAFAQVAPRRLRRPWLPDPGAPRRRNDDAPRQLELADDLSVAFCCCWSGSDPTSARRSCCTTSSKPSTTTSRHRWANPSPQCASSSSRARQRVAEDRRRFHATRAEQQDLAAVSSWRSSRKTRARCWRCSNRMRRSSPTVAARRSPRYGRSTAPTKSFGSSSALPGIATRSDFLFEDCWINNAPALLIREANGDAFATLSFEVDDGQIATVYSIRNPDKLDRIGHHRENPTEH